MSIIRITEGEHRTEIEGSWTVFTDEFEAYAGRFSHFTAKEKTLFGLPDKMPGGIDNAYIPVVLVDESSDVLFKTITSKKYYSTLSEHIEKGLRTQFFKQLNFKTNLAKLPVRFNVKKGNSNANDEDGGRITAYSFDSKKRHINTKVFEKLKYGDHFNFEWDKTEDISQIDFYADDEDWLYDGGVKNVFCGTVRIYDSLFRKIYANYPKPYTDKPCDGGFYNQCAIRMSIAIIGAEIPLENVKNKSNPGGQTYCKHNHVLGAFNLSEHLEETKLFGNYKLYNGTKQNVRDLLRYKTGILFFENFVEPDNGVERRSNEFRHIEVWNGYNLISGFDFQMFDATIIKFWEIE